MGQKAKEEVEEEVEVIILGGDEDDEGVGREAQQGGEVHPSGGTDSSLAEAASTLEVKHAIRHAIQVSQGKALPSNTTIVAPNPALVSLPPQASSSLLDPGPSGALTLGVRRAIAAACEQARNGAVPLCHSPCHSRPAPPSNSPAPGPQAAAGAGVGQAATEPPLAPAEAPL